MDESIDEKYTKAMNLLNNGDIDSAESILKVLINEFDKKKDVLSKKFSNNSNNPNNPLIKDTLSKYESAQGDIKFQLGRILYLKRQYEDALVLIGNLATKFTLKKEIQEGYCDMLILLKKYDEGLVYFANLIEKRSPINSYYVLYGKILLSANKKQESEVFVKKFIEKFPYSHISWNHRGNHYKTYNELQLAEESFKKAVEINPKFSLGWNNLGLLFMSQEKLSDAEKMFLKAVEFFKTKGISWYYLSIIYKNQNKLKKAVKAIEKSDSLRPNIPETLILKYQIYEQSGDSKNVKKTLIKLSSIPLPAQLKTEVETKLKQIS